MPALYNIYRPQTFAEVTAQPAIIQTITNQLATGKTAAAYMFSGSRGIGKTTVARLLARALNCEVRAVGESEPCNQCSVCTAAKLCNSLDIIEIDAASHTKVEETRENILEQARFAPSHSKYKVFIIDEVHMLSNASFNALLKTLEEPPAHTVFILATTELHKLPATVISRCQRFEFKRLSIPELMARLTDLSNREGITIEQNILARISRLSEGCLRDAESLLGQLLPLAEDNQLTEAKAALYLPTNNSQLISNLLQALSTNNLPSAIESLQHSISAGTAVKPLVDDLIETVRNLLWFKLGVVGRPIMEPIIETTFQSVEKSYSTNRLASLLDALLKARATTAPATVPHLPLELALITCITATPPTIPSFTPPTIPSLTPPTTPPLTSPLTSPLTPVSTSLATSASAPAVTTFGIPTPEDAEMLSDKWQRCLAIVGAQSPSLAIILQEATVDGVINQAIKIRVNYNLHLEQLTIFKNRQIIEAAITNITQQNFRLEFMLVPNLPPATVALAQALGAI
ncbi:MAG: DNA polymerase III subunit gamma/tau [Patescibacteria group bacterium]